MKFGVLGSGNAATGLAFILAKRGYEVYQTDLEQFLGNIRAIKKQGGVYGQLGEDGEKELVKVVGTESIEDVFNNCEIVFITTPAYGIKNFANKCKPYIRDGQKIILCPGSAGGSLEFKKELGIDYFDSKLIVCETSTVPYASRLIGPGHVNVILDVKKFIFSSLPRDKAIEDFAKKLWNGVQVESLMFTILSDGNPVIHPPIMIFNAGRIENTNGNFLFYSDGVTRATGNLIKAVDEERLAIGKKLNLDLYTEPEIGKLQGFMDEANYWEGYRNGPGFTMIKAPDTLEHRYLIEDVKYGLVFWSSLGKLLGVNTPAIDSIIELSSIALEHDYKSNCPRTIDSLNLSLDTIKKLAC